MTGRDGEEFYRGIEIYHLVDRGVADERGWVLFPWKGRHPPIETETCHIVHIKQGKTRGNHFHPQAAEWLCTIQGEGLLQWRSPGEDTVHELRLEPRRFCVRIPPGIRHAVTNTGGGEMLIFAAREQTPQGDQTVQEDV
jgi:oxalate decarboxylase/phosphoglucose isomerase-like protein (cupin superfamily)